MHVFINNPRLISDLQFFLLRAGCTAVKTYSHELEVEISDVPNDEQARREVTLYLVLWQSRKRFSGVEAYVVGGVSPPEPTRPHPGWTRHASFPAF